MKKMMPIAVVLLSAVVGGGAGYFLKLKLEAPSTGEEETPGGVAKHGETEVQHGASAPKGEGRVIEKKSAVGANEKAGKHGEKKDGHGQKSEDATYMKFSRQFVAPIVKSGRPVAMLVMDIMLELDPSTADGAYPMEPKLRDAALKVLLRQAGEGRLPQIFQDPEILEEIKLELMSELRPIVGDGLKSVLIMDLGYQEY